MPIVTEKSKLLKFHSSNSRLLGFDVGEKTIGMALSDDRLVIASPLRTINRTKWTKDVEEIGRLIKDFNVFGFVVGLPINMDGSEGPRCQSTRQFANNLLEKFDLPLHFWDERLSTAAVTRTMLEADLSRKRQKQVVDKMAASYILQGFLDLRV